MNYHAGGVKVDEMASSVGLGWALNAGVVISRTMRGIPDEIPLDGFLDKTLPNESASGNLPNDVSYTNRTFYRMNSGFIDTQNDIFNYNFNGRSGRFLLGKNGDILFLEQAKLRVEKFTQQVNGRTMFVRFIITDELGYKYIFSDYEITQASLTVYNQTYTSSWYLSEIISPAGTDKILFSYEDTYLHANQISATEVESIPIIKDGGRLYAELSSNATQSINTKRIKSIIFPDNNLVNFEYDNLVRQDVNTTSREYLLKKISIQKETNVLSYLLDQDYSLSGRATLKSVTQSGGISAKTIKPYLF